MKNMKITLVLSLGLLSIYPCYAETCTDGNAQPGQAVVQQIGSAVAAVGDAGAKRFSSFSCKSSSGELTVTHMYGKTSDPYEYKYLYTQIDLGGSSPKTFKTRSDWDPPYEDKQTGKTIYSHNYSGSDLSGTPVSLRLKTTSRSAKASGSLAIGNGQPDPSVQCTYTVAIDLAPPGRVPSAIFDKK
jgi:hypothetical protein